VSAAWKQKHPSAVHEQLKRYRMRVRVEVLKAYGGKCVDCGDENLDHLELDHEAGGGNEQRAQIFGYGHGSPGGWNYYLWLRKQGFPQDMGLRCLCHDCHNKKHGRTKKDEGESVKQAPRRVYAAVCAEEDALY